MKSLLLLTSATLAAADKQCDFRCAAAGIVSYFACAYGCYENAKTPAEKMACIVDACPIAVASVTETCLKTDPACKDTTHTSAAAFIDAAVKNDGRPEAAAILRDNVHSSAMCRRTVESFQACVPSNATAEQSFECAKVVLDNPCTQGDRFMDADIDMSALNLPTLLRDMQAEKALAFPHMDKLQVLVKQPIFTPRTHALTDGPDINPCKACPIAGETVVKYGCVAIATHAGLPPAEVTPICGAVSEMFVQYCEKMFCKDPEDVIFA